MEIGFVAPYSSTAKMEAASSNITVTTLGSFNHAVTKPYPGTFSCVKFSGNEAWIAGRGLELRVDGNLYWIVVSSSTARVNDTQSSWKAPFPWPKGEMELCLKEQRTLSGPCVYALAQGRCRRYSVVHVRGGITQRCAFRLGLSCAGLN